MARPAQLGGPAAGGAGRLLVSDVGPGGFTVELALPAGGDLGFGVQPDNARCLTPRLPAVTGDAASPGGRGEYGWLIGLPDALAPAVEILELRTERRAVPHRCPAVAVASPTPRVARDYTLEAAAEMSAARPVLAAGAGAVVPDATAPVVTVETAGTLRQQALGRLVVRPVARAGADGLVVRTFIRARVRYAEGGTIARSAPLDGPFAAVTGVLLNYDYLPCRLPCGRSVARTGHHAADSLDDRPRQSPDAAADPDALKVVVDRDGPVAVTGAQLAAAGWDLTAVDPANLSLSMGGRTQAVSVDDGGDGRFDGTDRITFQGQAMTGPYTRDNVYWLRRVGPPTPFGQRDAAPGAATTARSFTETERFEQDTRIVWSMTQAEGADRWMWGNELTGPAQISHTLALGNLAPAASPASLRVALQGYTDDRAVNPDHHLRLWWNGRAVLDTRVDGLGVHLLQADLAPGDLIEGGNQLIVESVGDTGAVVDAVFLNWVEVEHAAGYRAAGDRLDFRAPADGRFDFTLMGFTGPNVTVLDVTDPAAPVALTGARVEQAGDGTYAVRFADTATDATRYVAFAPNAAQAPARIVRNQPSTLSSAANGADYVVITHPDFAAAITPLAEHRAAQGLRVRTVLIDDIYDEFSAGVFDPRAIRSFLRHAFDSWQAPAPTYVLLVGESNLDYRRGMGAGPANYVPSVQVDVDVDPLLTMYTSDLWFAALHAGDVLPDLLIGRISAARAADVSAIVGKTLRYEAMPIEDAWRRQALLVADDDGAPAFEAGSERLAALMPPGNDVRRFYAASYPRERNLAADIRAALDEGAFVLNFNGHGNVALWSPWPGGGYIFANSDIAALRNGDRMPILTSGSCMTGWIDHPLKPVSMTEQWLLNPAGGGVVAWSATSFAAISDEEALLVPFYRGLYDGRGATAGALVAAASAEAFGYSPSYTDVIRQYLLLGDPALVLSAVPIVPTPTPTSTPNAAWLPFAQASGPRR